MDTDLVSIKKNTFFHFHDGAQLNKEFEAMYLGNEINRTVNIKHEILNKMSEVRRTWFKLSAYWKASGASKKWKLIIFDAIIRSKLLCGLETIHLTQALSKSLDAFQSRSLRIKNLKRPSTFIDRSCTNQKILEEATANAFPTRGDNRQIIRFSDYQYMKRRCKLLGHIVRSNNDDPMRQVSFVDSTASRVDYGTKRVGKPRQNWLHFTKKFAYENVLKHHNTHDARIYAAALNRNF